jgi:hypothetical protein
MRPRCGSSDSNEFRTVSRWKKREIAWFFSGGTVISKRIAEKALKTWKKVTNLNFKYSIINPDIAISWKKFNHTNLQRYSQNAKHCYQPLDGKGVILAHAFFPNNDEWTILLYLQPLSLNECITFASCVVCFLIQGYSKWL